MHCHSAWYLSLDQWLLLLQVGKLQRSQTKGMTDLRGVLTVTIIRAKHLEVLLLMKSVLLQNSFWCQVEG